ncbi:hypothetical protein Tco_0814755 [Tanacetum coccineum]
MWKANISKNSLVLRLKASKSGPLKKHAEERENLYTLISIPRAFPEDVASPVELARARSRGRTTMYRMARPTSYYRGLHFSKRLVSIGAMYKIDLGAGGRSC